MRWDKKGFYRTLLWWSFQNTLSGLLSASVCKEIIIIIIRNYNYISSFNIKIYTKIFIYSLLKLV